MKKNFSKIAAFFFVAIFFVYANDQARAKIIGKVIDYSTGEAIHFAEIHIEPLHKHQNSDEKGEFLFTNVPFGIYTINIDRVGYESLSIEYEVEEKESSLLIKMLSSSMSSDVVVVESDKYKTIIKPDLTVGGKDLRKNLSTTIAETITKEPGVSFRSMGAAPARPVLRGLGGDRLLVLEDHSSAGDMSATSADHSVAIDPMTSDHIDIVRGPESILFGSNASGGVINVIRGSIPDEKITELEGVSSLQGSSVSESFAIGQSLAFPVDLFSFKIDGSFRKAENIQSPEKTIENSWLETINFGAGTSYQNEKFMLGASFSYYKSDYGIPPDPLTGHASGVNIDMKRTQFKNKLKYFFTNKYLNLLKIKHAFSRYQHAEIENALGIVGQSFGVVTHDIDINLMLNSFENFKNGVLGSTFSYRDYKTGGLSNTPQTLSKNIAFFAYHKYKLNESFSADFSLRYDYKSIEPLETNSRIGSTGLYPKLRTFSGFSGGFSAEWDLNKNFSLSISSLKTFRSPTLEDLFSDGPHLANYVFEIGNPELNSEYGWSNELTFAFENDVNYLQLTGFINSFDGFIFSENTGKFSRRIATLYEYQYVGKNALMYGAEFSARLKPIRCVKIDTKISYVFGELSEENKALPYIPPIEGNVSFTYDYKGFSASVITNFGAKQDRIYIPDVLYEEGRELDLAEFKKMRSTDAYTTFDFVSEFHFSKFDRFHTVTFSVNNIFNTVYQKHLNRIKHIFPEPGRDIKLLYKLYF
jgi:iron complex outermembrane receptor protein